MQPNFIKQHLFAGQVIHVTVGSYTTISGASKPLVVKAKVVQIFDISCQVEIKLAKLVKVSVYFDQIAINEGKLVASVQIVGEIGW